MARVTVEDCLERVPNRFALTVLAAKRARALAEGKARPLVECDNKEAVTALREVAAGKVRFAEDVDTVLGEFIEEQRHQYRVTSSQAGYIEAIDLGGLVDDDEDAELLAGEDDVEELPSDPSLLSKRAKADLEDADDDADGADDIDDDDDATADLDDVEVDVADVGEDDDDAAADDDEE